MRGTSSSVCHTDQDGHYTWLELAAVLAVWDDFEHYGGPKNEDRVDSNEGNERNGYFFKFCKKLSCEDWKSKISLISIMLLESSNLRSIDGCGLGAWFSPLTQTSAVRNLLLLFLFFATF